MFRRKRPEDETPKSVPDAMQELQLPVKPGARPAPATATVPMRPPVMPPRAPGEGLRPGAAPTPTPAQPARREPEVRKLIVGREISVAGEITSCDRLVVEGSVEANLANCRDIEIADTGVYKGSASIEEAQIRGRFNGVLNVRHRLLIRATGRVTGTVRYGQIEIERGGQISGDVQAQPTVNELPPSLTETRPPAETPPSLTETRPLVETPRESDLVE